MSLTSLYESIDVAKIDDFIASGQEENLHLDFKLVSDSRMTRDDKKNLAKALSGFANSDGGIVVWGVDARPNANGVNCAFAKQEISSVSLLLSKLNEFTGDHVNPMVDGVLHRTIVVNQDSGFAVTMVPQSDAGPHLAKGGEDRYYKRSGDSFRRMEHFDIEDMFGRRSHPQLRLTHRVVRSTGRPSFKVILSLENNGRGSARTPYLAIKVTGPCGIDRYGIDGNGHEGLNRLVSSGDSAWYRYGSMGGLVIHPETSLDVLALNGKFDPAAPGFTDIVIDYEIAAEGFRLAADKLVIEVNALIDQIERAWRA